MAEILVSDELTNADRIGELETIRDLLNNAGADAGPIENIVPLGPTVLNLIKHIPILWNQNVTDVEAYEVLRKSSIFLGFLVDYKTEDEIAECSVMVEEFVKLMIEGERAGRGKIVTRVLYDMFEMFFPIKSKAKFIIFCGWLNCVSKENSRYLLPMDKNKINQILKKYGDVEGSDERRILRAYQCALQRLERFDEATDAMYDLLKSHPDPSSEEAQNDGKTSIIQAVTTKNQFRFDHLLNIPAIESLCDSPIYRLLKIFINGDLDDFESFITEHTLATLGIEEHLEKLREKMRLLTFVELASKNRDVEYKVICSKLGLEGEEVEELVVRSFQLKLVRGRLDEGNERVATTYSITREFGEGEWVDLKNKLEMWRQNMDKVQKSVEEVEHLAADL